MKVNLRVMAKGHMMLTKEERAQRLRNRAERYRKESNQHYEGAKTLASLIPLGQPILVGHHSEGSHRRHIERIHRGYEKSFDLSIEADSLERAARAAENNATIFSNDPKAVEALKEKIAAAEANQELMKKANVLIRKGDREGVVELLGEKIASEVLSPNHFGGIGYPSFSLTNNNCNIRRMKERLASLEKVKALPLSNNEINGIRIERDPNEFRLRLFFDVKPDEKTREKLKRLGFRWAPSVGSWQRHLNPAGERALRDFLNN